MGGGETLILSNLISFLKFGMSNEKFSCSWVCASLEMCVDSKNGMKLYGQISVVWRAHRLRIADIGIQISAFMVTSKYACAKQN